LWHGFLCSLFILNCNTCFQSLFFQDWSIFTVLLVTVLGALFLAWINPSTGLGDEYIQFIESVVPGHSSEAAITLLLTIFGVAHSGLASLRPWAEEVIGARVREDENTMKTMSDTAAQTWWCGLGWGVGFIVLDQHISYLIFLFVSRKPLHT